MDDEKVAVAVQQRSAIYDKNNPKHRNRDVLRMLWKECAAEVGVTEVEVVKKRWGYLRDYFTKQYRDKMKAASKQPGQGMKRTKWPLYDTMSFLIPYIEQRETDQRENCGTNNHLFTHVEAVRDDQHDSEVEQSFDDNSGPSRGQSVEVDESLKNEQEHPETESPFKIESFQSINRKRLNDNSFSSRPKRYLSSERSSSLLADLKEANFNDDDDYFFKSLKPMLRQLDPLKKLHFRAEVLKLLMNFLQSPSSTSSSFD